MSDVVHPLPLPGNTYYGPTADIPTTYGATIAVEGTEGTFDCLIPNTSPGAFKKRHNGRRKAIFVRNKTGADLAAGDVVTYLADYRKRRVGAKSATAEAAIAGVVDDMLGSKVVRDGDLFWLFVEGPVVAKKPAGVIAEGDPLGCDNGGKLTVLDVTPADATAALNAALNCAGVAYDDALNGDATFIADLKLRV